MAKLRIPDEEIETSYDQNEDGLWIARVFHKPTSTIKISDYFLEKSAALQQALSELNELVEERLKGLGKREKGKGKRS